MSTLSVKQLLIDETLDEADVCAAAGIARQPTPTTTPRHRSPHVWDRTDDRRAHLTAGSSTQKQLPLSGCDCTPTRPPWLSTSRFTVARPSPVPLTCSFGPRTNGSNSVDSISGGIPGPVS